MRRYRVSIAGLMAFVLFAALAFASLHEATDQWARGMFTLAVAACGVALLGTLFRRGAARAPWAGFLIFGAGYLTLTTGPWLGDLIGPRLLTTDLFDDLYRRLAYAPRATGEFVLAQDSNSGTFHGGTVTRIDPITPRTSYEVTTGSGPAWYYDAHLRRISLDEYRQLGHSVLSLLFAFVGAGIAWWFATGGEGPDRARPARGDEP
jgi:hypothetical protein